MDKNEKQQKYETLIEQVKAFSESERDETFHFWWTGFYRVVGQELVLGPFQGPVACTRIKFGRGVCGTAWKEKRSIVVEDVEEFPGHIACSSASRSEIVVPIFSKGEVVAELDIDSENLATFYETDKLYLEKIVENMRLTE